MTYLIIPLLALAFLIFVHELGHFAAARLVKVKVEEFAIGFPPRLFSKVISGTKYSFGALFLGGFVRLKGQNLDDENPNEADNYAAKSKKERFFIIFSGPLINILLAFLLIPLAYKIGLPSVTFLSEGPTVIEDVLENSPAQSFGFQKFDEISMVDDIKVNSWEEFFEVVIKKRQQPQIDVTVNTDSANNDRRVIKVDLKDLAANQNFAQQIGLVPLIPAVVGKINDGWPADTAGFVYGDKITAINGEKISSLNELRGFLQQNTSKPASFSIVRKTNNTEKKLTIITPARFDESTSSWALGFATPTKVNSYSWGESIEKGFKQLWDLTVGIGTFFKNLFQNNVSKDDVGGPVMIFKVIGDASERGLAYFIIIVSFISLQLGIFNLLPLPVLDGGHIMFLVYEFFAGKQPSIKTRNIFQYVSFMLLIALMVAVTIKDILNI